MQYQDSYIKVQGKGVQHKEKVCSSKIVTLQYEVRVCSIRRGSPEPRQLHHNVRRGCAVSGEHVQYQDSYIGV